MSEQQERRCAREGCPSPAYTGNAIALPSSIGTLVVYVCAEHFALFLSVSIGRGTPFAQAPRQEILNNAVQVQRHEAMKTSEQLLLGELILKLEAVEDKHKPVIFNEQYHPTDIISWRGSYSELSLAYAETGQKYSVEAWLSRLRGTVGAIRYGYKGGEFFMGKTTPVWVANYGESAGFIGDTQAVIGISENEQAVIIETKPMEY